ncbi:RNA-binding domain-containing protein [Methanococcoides sp. NM1]|uniref:RNA-binding domain-containing protein n=1 Tax=Methanococcoides sp. NM1 TaxID=1201013 RepID=UPI0010830F5B|nr:RNA-binding domain-containing protein [Methanococcoides sp. NM1]
MKIRGDFFTSQGPPKLNQIVDLTSLKIAKRKFDQNIEREKGNIVLVIGPRGIGKSTTLTYLKGYVDTQKGSDFSRIIDIGLHFTELLDKEFNERTTAIFKIIARNLSNGASDDIANVISILDGAEEGPFFLFIDNLDRLYQNQGDLSYINSFFRTADPILKKLSEKMVIVISCAPEWKSFLGDRDLSYINFTNSIKLEPLSNEEVRSLIEYRAKVEGYEVSDIVDEDLIPVLNIASRGNPRSIFQFLEKVADEAEMPINIQSFQKVVGSELFQGAIEELKRIASKSPKISWGINQTWRYFDSLQKNGIDNKIGIKTLVIIHKNGFVSGSETKNMKGPLLKISQKTQDDKYVLNDQVREMLTEWYRKTKVNKEILLAAYSENLFTLFTTDVDDYVDKFQSALSEIDIPSKVFDDSFKEYMLITSQHHADERIKFVNHGWKCLKSLMLSIIAIVECGIPKDLSERLSDKKKLEDASNDLISEIAQIYKSFNKSNPYKSEVQSVRARYLDVSENPEVAEYWDSEQMNNFIRQVTNSYEGMIRTLKPSMLLTSDKRKETDEILSLTSSKESIKIEFKSSILWDYTQNKVNKDLKYSSLKTIVAFLNTKGGKLILGVNDNNEIIGIEKDILTLKRKNIDGYEQRISELIDLHIGSDLSYYVESSYHRIKGYLICILSIEKSPYPAYLEKDGKRLFFMRSGNTTRQLDGEQCNKYVANIWK